MFTTNPRQRITKPWKSKPYHYYNYYPICLILGNGNEPFIRRLFLCTYFANFLVYIKFTSTFSSQVILVKTAYLSSSMSSLIFFTPRPTLNKICFSIAVGVLDETESAIQTKLGIQGFLCTVSTVVSPWRKQC